MRRTMKSQLKDWEKKNVPKRKKSDKHRKLTKRELKYLMDENKPKYYRTKGGAMRQR